MADGRSKTIHADAIFRRIRPSWRVAAVVIWLSFSVALAIWWLIFGLRQVERMSELAGTTHSAITLEIARQHRMLVSEGGTLVVLLIVGGATLLYYVRSEILRSARMREFFGAFTHDLKTSLASLRLQAESLEEDLRESGQEQIVRRLVKDTVRLELQLENSLLLASSDDNSKLFIEPIGLVDLFQGMRHQWPDLQFEIDGDATVAGDRRAIDSIFKNIFQNAMIHGRASKLIIRIERNGQFATVQVLDNGRGFKGDVNRLGRIFERHSNTSGSGLGLYLAASLAKRMNGEFRHRPTSEGFCVEVVLPEVR